MPLSQSFLFNFWVYNRIMIQEISDVDVPIKSAVLAWQPAFLPQCRNAARPGTVAVFNLNDRREAAYEMTHGAVWFAWREQSVKELIRTLRGLRRVLMQDYAIKREAIDEALAVIPEYRRYIAG